jgi:predicted DNA-binding WGR domain protein
MNEHPEKFYNVSQTQLSIARHYGGIKYNGRQYTYNPTDDTLTLVPEKKRRPTKKKT